MKRRKLPRKNYNFAIYLTIFLQALKVMETYCLSTIAPHVRESEGVLDSGFHDVDSGFQVLDSSLCVGF